MTNVFTSSTGAALAPWKWAQEQQLNNAYAEYAELGDCGTNLPPQVTIPRYSHHHEIEDLGKGIYRMSWLVRRNDGTDYMDSYTGDQKSAIKFARKHGVYWEALKKYGGTLG